MPFVSQGHTPQSICLLSQYLLVIQRQRSGGFCAARGPYTVVVLKASSVFRSTGDIILHRSRQDSSSVGKGSSLLLSRVDSVCEASDGIVLAWVSSSSLGIAV